MPSASYKRALAAQAAKIFEDEIVAVDAPSGKITVKVSEDETPKKFNEEKLRQLRPAFGKDGTVTAGNASSINDGAAAIVALSADKARAWESSRRAHSWLRLGLARTGMVYHRPGRRPPEAAGQTFLESRRHRSV